MAEASFMRTTQSEKYDKFRRNSSLTLCHNTPQIGTGYKIEIIYQNWRSAFMYELFDDRNSVLTVSVGRKRRAQMLSSILEKIRKHPNFIGSFLGNNNSFIIRNARNRQDSPSHTTRSFKKATTMNPSFV